MCSAVPYCTSPIFSVQRIIAFQIADFYVILHKGLKCLERPSRPLFPGKAMSMTEDSSFECLTCPNPLRRRVRSSTIASTKCNLASKSSHGMPFLALTPQIQRNIALSCCRSETFGPKFATLKHSWSHTRVLHS